MVATSLLSLLLSNAVTLRRDKAILYSRTGICILVYVFLLGSDALNLVSVGNGLGLYGGLFNATATTLIFQNFLYLLSAIILLLTGFFPRKVMTNVKSGLLSLRYGNIINKKAEHFKIIEYPLILLFVLTGATFLISSNDIVSIFISIELQSYGLYLLAASYRNSELSTSASLTYFLLGGLSSCFILLGTALLYANSGVTSLESFYIINNIWDISKQTVMFTFENNYINYALIVMVVGFLFKISAAPFHFWSPDVYDAIPTIVTTFVAIVAKISILIFLFEIVHYTSNSVFNSNLDWRYTLLLSSLLSLIIGTVLGLNQFRIKRLYAYSTISHLGFILLALSINTIESIQAFMFYLIQYSISNLNAFIILISIGFSLYLYTSENHSTGLIDRNNSPIQLISQLKGYFQFNPIIAISLAITIYSFVGIPPLLGFFAKQMVLSAALDNGFIFISLIAILTSVISAVYYLNIIKQIFFDKFTYTLNNEFKETEIKSTDIKLSGAFSISISILTLLLISYIFFSNSTRLLAVLLFNI